MKSFSRWAGFLCALLCVVVPVIMVFTLWHASSSTERDLVLLGFIGGVLEFYGIHVLADLIVQLIRVGKIRRRRITK
jgi:hypothetical protein